MMTEGALQDRFGYEEPDEQIALIDAINEAETRGDDETVRKLSRKLEPLAKSMRISACPGTG